MISAGRRRSFQRRVLSWYAANGRDLPWRKTRDPYAILVSEILSHQTQIARVVPVYEQLLRLYPTVDAMAKAPLRSVKAITDPLGYKIRGRWLHGCALKVAENGAFPRSVDELRRLPGVGRYTAGALASFAHRQDVPAVDTNVGRVLSRHFADLVGTEPRPAVRWQLAAEVLPKGRGHVLNQALMDIGALVCTARAPHCPSCPLRRSCAAKRDHRA